jgi:hypothetical protein
LRSSARRTVFPFLACGLCLIAAPRRVAAEWHITPMLGVTVAGKTTILDPQLAAGKQHPAIGGAVTLLGAGVLGAETVLVLTPGFFQTARTSLDTDTARVDIKSSRLMAVMGNAVLTLPRRLTEFSLRPFVSGGFGILHATQTPAVEAAPLVHPGMAGFNVGGGAVGFLTKRTGVRFDLRYYQTLRGKDPSDGSPLAGPRLRYMTASIGLVIRR